MPKSPQQKKKLLCIARILLEQSDEKHPVQVPVFLRMLENMGIHAERKSIYDDIEELKLAGMKIGHRRKLPSGFYIEERLFPEGELRLLLDAVRFAPFISEEKAEELAGKMRKLASIHQGRSLRGKAQGGQIRRRVLDEQIYLFSDAISAAMEADRQISFQYLEWNMEKKLVPRKNGERYLCSPWGLLWNDGYYYMIAIDEKSGVVKHYRVDKMRDIRQEKEGRTGNEMFRGFNAEEFASKTFGMFGGREESLLIRFENSMAGVLIDRFGEDVRILQEDALHFRALLRVRVSRQFFGWLAALGQGVEILEPEETRTEYRKFLSRALEPYTRKPDDPEEDE